MVYDLVVYFTNVESPIKVSFRNQTSKDVAIQAIYDAMAKGEKTFYINSVDSYRKRVILNLSEIRAVM